MPVKKTSLNEIARCLGVSKTLVSFVLNGRGNENGISQKTQEIVYKKAKELNYKPNPIARGLRLGKSQTIGLVIADISNTFYAKIAKRVEEVAGNHNYNVVFCSSDENPEKEIELINMLKERRVDGMIISTSQNKASIFSDLKSEKFPFVLIDRKLPRISTNFAGVDNFNGAYQATNQLLKNGCRKIALFKITPDYLSTVKDREKGYREALKENGIRVNNKIIRSIDCSNIRNDVRNCLDDILRSEKQIDSILPVNNNIAVACLEYLNEMNIRIPEDIAIVSFDDIDLFRLSKPSITAVAQPVEKIGEESVKMLIDEINGRTHDNKQVVLPVKLIERRSCGVAKTENRKHQ
jgi:LacI family transcriptional regulator